MLKGILNFCLKIFASQVINKSGRKQKGVNKVRITTISLWPTHLFSRTKPFLESPWQCGTWALSSMGLESKI